MQLPLGFLHYKIMNFINDGREFKSKAISEKSYDVFLIVRTSNAIERQGWSDALQIKEWIYRALIWTIIDLQPESKSDV